MGLATASFPRCTAKSDSLVVLNSRQTSSSACSKEIKLDTKGFALGLCWRSLMCAISDTKQAEGALSTAVSSPAAPVMTITRHLNNH